MSIYTKIIESGELNSSGILKAITLSRYEREAIFAGLNTGKLSNRQKTEILKNVESGVYHDKNHIISEIAKSIDTTGMPWEEKMALIKKTKHSYHLARKIVGSVHWHMLSTKNLEKAINLSDYNYFVLLSALETGRVSNNTKFEAIKKVSSSKGDRQKIAETVIKTNHWGKMSVLDCCMAITLSGGNEKIAQKVRDLIDFSKMSYETILNIIELSGSHVVIMQAVGEEIETRNQQNPV